VSTWLNDSHQEVVMNQYPLWKYLLILASLLAGLIYTLPNLYGESPAVQVSPLRSSLKADAALLGRVESALHAANLNPELTELDGNSVKARFADTDTQLKAKDVLVGQLGEDYVVALNLLPRSPHWLTKLNALPMISRSGLARRGAFPAASGHECRAEQGSGCRCRGYSRRFARSEHRLFRLDPRR